MSDDPVPELTTAQNGHQVPVASLDSITVLVHSFGSMITAMEARITARIAENAAASKERWARWESDFEKYRDATDRRLELLEGRVHAIEQEDEHDELVWDARVGPLRNAGLILARNWKTILLVLFAALGFVAVGFDVFARYLGLPT